MPVRIQRKRTKGWKMPDNTVYVGRPTKYGNEWTIKAGRTREDCVAMYERTINAYKPEVIEEIKKELGGKDLACWCPLTLPCHADILLKVANS